MVKGYQGPPTVIMTRCGLGPLDKTIHHLLLAGLVEGDGELVAVDLDDMAVAEFLVEYAVVEGKFRDRAGGFCHQPALDGHGPALGSRGEAAEIARRGFATRARERRLLLLK